MIESMMITRFLAVLALAGVAVGVGGCRGDRSDKPPRQFMPDMDDSPKWNPQTETEFYADGRAMRHPVTGTVAFGQSSVVPAGMSEAWEQDRAHQRDVLLKEDSAYYLGLDADGGYVSVMPVKVNRALLERGQRQFDIYCSACHGFGGDGQGMVAQKWTIPVPGFQQPKYQDRAQRTGKDGYLFHVARNGVVGVSGVQSMPGYAHAINEDDAWAVVSYIRALQVSQSVNIDDAIIPDDVRQTLSAAGGAAGGGSAKKGQ